jgi:hypothetical protein
MFSPRSILHSVSRRTNKNKKYWLCTDSETQHSHIHGQYGSERLSHHCNFMLLAAFLYHLLHNVSDTHFPYITNPLVTSYIWIYFTKSVRQTYFELLPLWCGTAYVCTRALCLPVTTAPFQFFSHEEFVKQLVEQVTVVLLSTVLNGCQFRGHTVHSLWIEMPWLTHFTMFLFFKWTTETDHCETFTS